MSYLNKFVLSLLLLIFAILLTSLSYSMQNRDNDLILQLNSNALKNKHIINHNKYVNYLAKELISALVDALENGKVIHHGRYLGILNKENISQKKDDKCSWHSMLILSIDRAWHCLAWGLEIQYLLSIIEKLLQVRLINYLEIESNYIPLEKALSLQKPDLGMIRLLLNYGATITENCENWAKNKYPEIREEIFYHKNLREKVLIEPIKELLKEAISRDNPFVVNLIAKNSPQLIESAHLELAKEKSPASLAFLNKRLETIEKIKRFVKATDNKIPNELIQYIRKLVDNNYNLTFTNLN